MNIDLVKVDYVKDYVYFFKFEDGVSGELDLSDLLKFEGVFYKLKDLTLFKTGYLNQELGTIEWDKKLNLCPDVIYAKLTNTKINLNKIDTKAA